MDTGDQNIDDERRAGERRSLIDRRTSTTATLENHIIECGARYDILSDTVNKQGRQMDKIEELATRIDDKLDSTVHNINQKMSEHIDKTNDRIIQVEKNVSSNITQILIGVVLGLAGFVASLIFSSLSH